MQQTTLMMEELRAICSDVWIQDERSFLFRDELIGADAVDQIKQAEVGADADSRFAPLIDRLRDHLYAKCYTRNYLEIASTESHSMSIVKGTPSEFLATLIEANATSLAWDDGWKIYQVGADGRISIQKGDRSRAANPGEFARDDYSGAGPKIGESVSLRVYPGSTQLQSVFYFTFGATLSDQFDEYAMVRFYFNITADSAAFLLKHLSCSLNHYLIPYRYKSLATPDLYRRADAAILYVSKRYFHIVADLIEQLYPHLMDKLRHEVPLFCLEWLPGIGVADDTGTGESFGKHRCRLLAQGLVEAWAEEASGADQKLEAVKLVFERQGLNLETPYLNAGTCDIFTTPDLT